MYFSSVLQYGLDTDTKTLYLTTSCLEYRLHVSKQINPAFSTLFYYRSEQAFKKYRSFVLPGLGDFSLLVLHILQPQCSQVTLQLLHPLVLPQITELFRLLESGYRNTDKLHPSKRELAHYIEKSSKPSMHVYKVGFKNLLT